MAALLIETDEKGHVIIIRHSLQSIYELAAQESVHRVAILNETAHDFEYNAISVDDDKSWMDKRIKTVLIKVYETVQAYAKHIKNPIIIGPILPVEDDTPEGDFFTIKLYMPLSFDLNSLDMIDDLTLNLISYWLVFEWSKTRGYKGSDSILLDIDDYKTTLLSYLHRRVNSIKRKANFFN